jgi:type II secretory pathway pseudopilin PulG
MRSGERGFTYIGLLVLIMLIGFMLAAAGQVAATTAKREREKELLFVGHQYREAIARFMQQNHRYPQELTELLEFSYGGPAPAHYLRRLYPDPMTRAADWILVPAPGGGIMGIASSSAAAPLKRANFDDVDQEFEGAESYSDWMFVFRNRLRRYPVQSPGVSGITTVK